MRDYAKVSSQFWLSKPARQLRGCPEAQVVAFYLQSNPHANMIGLYYLPNMFISHETGLTLKGASKGLQRCIEAGFCAYDHDSEFVWIYEMASEQIASQLAATDNRCKGIQSLYNELPDNQYLQGFYEKYGQAFCMKQSRGKASTLQAPLKPLASQEQEQEQEQEHKQEQKTICSEPQSDSKPKESKVVLDQQVIETFLLNDNTEFLITQDIYEQFVDVYPGVNIKQELGKIKGWCFSNKSKRKTKKGALAFLNNWLSKAQDTATRNQAPPPPHQQRRTNIHSGINEQDFSDVPQVNNWNFEV